MKYHVIIAKVLNNGTKTFKFDTQKQVDLFLMNRGLSHRVIDVLMWN